MADGDEPSEITELSPQDMSHMMLIAIIMREGGHLDLPLSALETDIVGNADGSMHAVAMSPLPGGPGVRLSVVARPARIRCSAGCGSTRRERPRR